MTEADAKHVQGLYRSDARHGALTEPVPWKQEGEPPARSEREL